MSCRRILEIYVAPDCFGCETARDLAGMLHACGWPHLEVRLLDLSQPHVTRPAAVFAVPTYILDGRVISLGNPEEGWLLDQVAPSSPGAADDAHHICHPTQAR